VLHAPTVSWTQHWTLAPGIAPLSPGYARFISFFGSNWIAPPMRAVCTRSPCPQIPRRVASTPTVSWSASSACGGCCSGAMRFRPCISLWSIVDCTKAVLSNGLRLRAPPPSLCAEQRQRGCSHGGKRPSKALRARVVPKAKPRPKPVEEIRIRRRIAAGLSAGTPSIVTGSSRCVIMAHATPWWLDIR
jgi:hypothetical protein